MDEVRLTRDGLRWEKEWPVGPYGDTSVEGPGLLGLEAIVWQEAETDELRQVFAETVDLVIEQRENFEDVGPLPYSAYPSDRLSALLWGAIDGLGPTIGGGERRDLLGVLDGRDLDRLRTWGKEEDPFQWTYSDKRTTALRDLVERVEERRQERNGITR